MQTARTTARSHDIELKPRQELTLLGALRMHWPEYLCEATGLGLFMLCACAFGVLLEHPSSAIAQAIDSPILRHALGGAAMGITAITIFTSPFGQRSGAHINPAVTLNYYLLGKIEKGDAIFYVMFQFLGGIAGVMVAEFLIGDPLRHSAVNYAVTVPGPQGLLAAFVAEFSIAFLMMTVILFVSNSRDLTRLTPYFAGVLVAAFITIESPLSGMSMNPARTLGSSVPAQEWTALWIYFTAPPLAMVLAGQVYKAMRGRQAVYCAKLHHHNNKRCIFHCNYGGM